MILYEDAQLVVCCKPRGVLSAADSSGQESMASLLAPRTVFPVHRLDRGTSGVILVAKSDAAHRALTAAFARRDVVKEYLALVAGVPKSATGRIEKASTVACEENP
jgi:23S rRNA pseudouridine1911/1915/1917 synthase